MASKYVPTEELAKHFAVAGQTVRLWIKQGKIPAGTFIKIGNTYRFDIEAVEAALQARAQAQVDSVSIVPKEEPKEEPADEVAAIVDEVERQETTALSLDFDSDEDL